MIAFAIKSSGVPRERVVGLLRVDKLDVAGRRVRSMEASKELLDLGKNASARPVALWETTTPTKRDDAEAR